MSHGKKKKRKKKPNGRSEEFHFQHLLLMSLQLDCRIVNRAFAKTQTIVCVCVFQVEVRMLGKEKEKKFCAEKSRCFSVSVNKLKQIYSFLTI